MYLPAFPELADDFDASASSVQLTLTACLLGLGIGQIVTGPVSDALGRRRPLLVGLGVYVGASLLCAVSPSIYALAGLRFLQGLAAGAGVVTSRAVVRDLFTGPAASRFFSRMMLVNGLAPILAPTIGAAVLVFTSWRGVFVVLAGIGAVLLLGSWLGLRETVAPERRRTGGARESIRGFGKLLHSRTFVGYALGQGLALGAMFAYISGSPFVLQEIYGLSPRLFAASFGINAVAIVAGSQVNGFLVGRVAPRPLLLGGLGTLAGGGLALLAVVVLDAGLAGVLATLFVLTCSVGFIIPNATALALADHPHVAGSASALLGLTQFLVAAAAVPLVGVAGSDSALPMAAVIATLAVGAVAAIVTLTPAGPATARPLPAGGELG